MNPVDLALVIPLAAITALGAERRWGGLLVGAGGLLALPLLLWLAGLSALLAVAAALLLGGGLGLAGRRLRAGRRSALGAVAGAVGGGALALALVLSMATSLPLQRNPSGQIVYPPTQLPLVGQSVLGSRLVEEGRAILLYPLLAAQDDIPDEQRELVGFLHRLLVAEEPWRGR